MADGINVGDAVLTFLGDTTQLDQAFDKVGTNAKTKLQPAQDQLDRLGKSFTGFNGVVDESKNTWDGLTPRVQAATEAVKESEGAHGSLRSRIGIVDNTIRGAHAQAMSDLVRMYEKSAFVMKVLPLAAQAAAFLAVAGIIAEATKALVNLVSESFIYTSAMRESDKATAAANSTLEQQAKKLKELRNAYELIGKIPLEQTTIKIQQQSTELAKQQTILGLLKVKMDQLNEVANSRSGFIGTLQGVQQKLKDFWLGQVDTVAQAKQQLATLPVEYEKQAIAVRVLEQEQKNLTKELQVQQQEYSAAKQKASLQASKELADAEVQLEHDKQALLITQDKVAAAQRVGQQAQFVAQILALDNQEKQKRLANEITYNERYLAILRQNEAKNATEIIATENQIRVLRKQAADEAIQYQTRVEENNLKLAQTLAAVTEGLHNIKLKTPEALQMLNSYMNSGADAADKLASSSYRLGTAFQILGVESEAALGQKVKDAQYAYEELNKQYKEGAITTQELYRAKLQLLAVERALAVAQGRSTVAIDREANEIKRSMIPAVSTWSKIQKQASGDIMGAVGQAVAAYAQGQATIGQALAQMVQSILASLAQQAIVEAIVQTAYGFAALSPLSPDFGHAGEHFTSAAIWASVGVAAAAAGAAMGKNKNATTTQGYGQTVGSSAPAATIAQAQPVSQTNVQHFAAGGLVTGPTLAVIGDSMSGGKQREAAIPLDNPRAVSAIVEALGGGRGDGGIHVYVNGLISPDNLNKVVRQIDRRVRNGKSVLTSSNALRLTRRSA